MGGGGLVNGALAPGNALWVLGRGRLARNPEGGCARESERVLSAFFRVPLYSVGGHERPVRGPDEIVDAPKFCGFKAVGSSRSLKCGMEYLEPFRSIPGGNAGPTTDASPEWGRVIETS